MSDYYDDSFDSFDSGSESEGEFQNSGAEPLPPALQDPRVRELADPRGHIATDGIGRPVSQEVAGYGSARSIGLYSSFSDQDERHPGK